MPQDNHIPQNLDIAIDNLIGDVVGLPGAIVPDFVKPRSLPGEIIEHQEDILERHEEVPSGAALHGDEEVRRRAADDLIRDVIDQTESTTPGVKEVGELLRTFMIENGEWDVDVENDYKKYREETGRTKDGTPIEQLCFSGSTQILLANGKICEINKINIGDTVAAYAESTDLGRGLLTSRRVVRLYQNETTAWIKLTWTEAGASRELVATPGHHMLDRFGNFSKLEEMVQEGRVTLVLASGGLVEAVAERIIYSAETADRFERAMRIPVVGNVMLKPEPVDAWVSYNFEVEEFHTYIAGGVRVHNHSGLSEETKYKLLYGYMGNPTEGGDGSGRDVGIEIGTNGPKVPFGLMEGIRPLPGGGAGSGNSSDSDGDSLSDFSGSFPGNDLSDGSLSDDDGGDLDSPGLEDGDTGSDGGSGGTDVVGHGGGGNIQGGGTDVKQPGGGRDINQPGGSGTDVSQPGGGRDINEPGGSNPVDYWSPVLLDLNGDDDISITERSKSSFYVDGEDGKEHRTAWAGAGDGVLFFDAGNDGKITEKREFVFTEWTEGSSSDMEALREAFDSNHDGMLTSADAQWGSFKVMVTNADGTVTAKTLTELGITEIKLTPDATHIELPDGSVITGKTSFTQNGVTKTVADTSLRMDGEEHRWAMAA